MARRRQGEEAASRTVSPQDRPRRLSARAASAPPQPSPAPSRRPGPRPRLRSAGRRAPPLAPAPRERRTAAGRCPAERRGARPPGEEPEVINNSGGGEAGAPARGGLPPPARRPGPPLPKPGGRLRGERSGVRESPGSRRSGGVGLRGVLRDTSPPQTHARARTSSAHGRPWHRCGREERSGGTLEKVKSQPQNREETPATCSRQRLSIKNT